MQRRFAASKALQKYSPGARGVSLFFTETTTFHTTNGGLELKSPPTSAERRGASSSSMFDNSDDRFSSFEEMYGTCFGDTPTAMMLDGRQRLVSLGSIAAPPKSSCIDLVQSSPLAFSQLDAELRMPELSKEQEDALDAVLRGHSVFVTGGAGTGKSALLMHIVARLDPETTFVTATTGIAAINIGGSTLHSFSGIGHEDGATPQATAARALRLRQAFKRWMLCDTLIIEEISMLDADTLEALDIIARCVKCRDEVFGGIRLVLCGDFLQLPPMAARCDAKPCFLSPVWEALDLRLCYLRTNHRQSEAEFMHFLSKLRVGVVDWSFVHHYFPLAGASSTAEQQADSTAMPLATTGETVGQNQRSASHCYVKLRSRNAEVDRINSICFNEMCTSSRKPVTFVAAESTIPLHDCLAPHRLALCVGAPVMLLTNLLVARGLVNGAQGTVVGFVKAEDLPAKWSRPRSSITPSSKSCPPIDPVCILDEQYPLVSFTGTLFESDPIVVLRHTFSLRMGQTVTAWRSQLPLRLAWAITVHKSQGMTLRYLEVDVSSMFAEGQAYVALSRASCIHGLRVMSFSADSVRVNSAALEFYKSLASEGN